MEVTLYHSPDVAVDAAPPPGTVLTDFVAAMAPGTWAKVPTPANMDEAMLDPVALANQGNNNGILPYGGAVNDGYILGGDHGGQPKFVRYDAATHSFVVLETNTLGSHAYQHTWYPYKVLMGTSSLYKWDGAWNKVCDLPENAGQLIATALCVYNGKPIWYSGNSGILWQFDGPTWSQFAKHPNQSGVYQNVCHPVPGGIVFGGGHDFSGNWTGRRELYFSDGTTTTRMPDAPHDVGIEAMMVTGNGRGVMLVGYGEAHELDPVAKTITRRADPPATMLRPDPQPDLAKNLMSWEIPVGCVYIQYDRTRTPKGEMYAYRA